MVDKICLQFPAIESVTPIRMGGPRRLKLPPPLCCGVHQMDVICKDVH